MKTVDVIYRYQADAPAENTDRPICDEARLRLDEGNRTFTRAARPSHKTNMGGGRRGRARRCA